jgi:hypothetical protein
MSMRQENTHNVLTSVSLVLVWGDDNELARKGLIGVRPPKKGMRTSVGGGPCPESNKRDIAKSTPQNDMSL